MQKLMNLVTVVILLGGGYLVYQKWSKQQEDAADAAERREMAQQAASAKPAAQAATAQTPAPTPTQPAPVAATPAPAPQPSAAPEQPATTAATPAPAAPAAQPNPPAVATDVMPAPVRTDVMPTPPAAQPAPAVASATPAAPSAQPAPPPAAPPQPTPPPPAVLRPMASQPIVIGGQTAAGQSQESHKPLRELKPADYVAGLPVQAVAGYVQARAAAGQGGTGLMPLRSWMSVWLNRLRDPQKAMVELDFANLVLNSNERYVNEQVGAAAQQQNARTAKNIVAAIRKRNIIDEDLLAEIAKTEAAADQRLTTFK